MKILVLFIVFLSFIFCGEAFSFEIIKSLKVIKKEIIQAKFGSKADEIGVYFPPEARPLYPESFALSKSGEIYILDTANKRIQIFKNGKRIKTIPLPSEGYFEDIAITQDGRIIVLDNINEKSIFIIDSQGKVINKIPLEGDLISYAPEVSSLKIIDSGKWAGIWAEVEGSSVKLANLDGTETIRVAVPGKFYNDGTRIFDMKIIGDATFMLFVYDRGSLSKFEEVDIFMNDYICFINNIGTDNTERIYIDITTGAKACSNNYVLIINSNLEIIGKFKVEASHTENPIRVNEKGHIYQLIIDEKTKKVRIFQYEPIFD